MPVNIRSNIDSRGGLTATLPREGIDIGAMPDFWADLNALQSRLKPRARVQEWAMQRPTAQLGSLQQAPQAAPMPESLDRRIMQRADMMAAQDPNWLGMLSSGNLRHKWLPYATQLEGINLDNGWDVYAQMMGAGAPSSATAERAASEERQQRRSLGMG